MSDKIKILLEKIIWSIWCMGWQGWSEIKMTNQKATWQHREMGDIKHLWNEIYFAAELNRMWGWKSGWYQEWFPGLFHEQLNKYHQHLCRWESLKQKHIVIREYHEFLRSICQFQTSTWNLNSHDLNSWVFMYQVIPFQISSVYLLFHFLIPLVLHDQHIQPWPLWFLFSHTNIYICVHMYLCMCVYIHIFVCMDYVFYISNVYTHVCMYLCLYVCVCIYLWVYMCVYRCINI